MASERTDEDRKADAADASTRSRRRRLAFTFVVLAILAGQVFRAQSGLELSAETLRAFVHEQGVWAPITLVLLIAFRQFLLIPSGFLIGAGGLLFGAVQGAMLGALGLFVSTLFLYFVARGLAGDGFRQRIALRYPRVGRSVESSGPFVVFLTIAYPLGAATLVAVAAGLSSMRLGSLVIASASGAAVRGATYAYVGASLLQTDPRALWISIGVLAIAIVAPLAYAPWRRRLLGQRA